MTPTLPLNCRTSARPAGSFRKSTPIAVRPKGGLAAGYGPTQPRRSSPSTTLLGANPPRYEPGINRAYQDLANHYGCVVLPARVMKLRDRAKVEVPVQIVQRFVLTKLCHHRFFSPAELNAATRLRNTSAATPSCKPNPAIFRAR
jgi:hypothetical protein